MSIKEEAEELVFGFYHPLEHALSDEYADSAWQMSKEFALKKVERIKRELLENLSNDESAIHAIYWSKVKDEINSM